MNNENFRLLTHVAPDLIEQLNLRFRILKEIETHAPIGRRALATHVSESERIVRREVDYLESLHFVKIESKGIYLDQGAQEIIELLSAFLSPLAENARLSNALTEKYDIKRFYVVLGDADSGDETKESLGKMTARLLNEVFFSGATISVTGGSTMASVSDNLEPFDGDLLFIPARGGLGESHEYQANSIVSKLAEVTGGSHKLLHAPDYLSASTLDSLVNEPDVKSIIELNEQSDFVIHGIGEAFTMAERRHTPASEVKILESSGAVTEAFGFYFDTNGNVVHRINTVGIHLDALADKKQVFAVAGGKSKREAIHTYLKIAPKNTVLITDESVGEYLLNQ